MRRLVGKYWEFKGVVTFDIEASLRYFKRLILKDESRIIRSGLFVPGNRPERVEKALATKADLILIDLEDSVLISEKGEARSCTANKIALHEENKLFVLVNAFESECFGEDVEAIVIKGLGGIMIPKVGDVCQLREISCVLTKEEEGKNMSAGFVKLILLVETAIGVERVFEIAVESRLTNRVIAIGFGATDFCSDLGIEMTKGVEELIFPRA